MALEGGTGNRRGYGWLAPGGALILAANAVAIFVAPDFAWRQGGGTARASGAPRPRYLKAIAAAPRSRGHTQLFALEEAGPGPRLWSCTIGPSLICNWQQVLTPGSRP